jgi:LCP family protein required for cell wall assembly
MMQQPPPARPQDEPLPPPPPVYVPRGTHRATRASPPQGPPPPVPPSVPREPRHSRRWWFALPVALVVYAILALVTLVQPVEVAGLSLYAPVPGVPPERIFGLPDRPFTVMVVGLDVRPSQVGGPARTDSILLIRVDAGRNRAGIVSIPRDTMMQIPIDGGTDTDRINTAYVYNWSADDPGAAIDALQRTIENNLGITIDYHVIFDQRGAAKIIDGAGGVDVFVREAFGQEDYSDDDVNVVPQFFPEGRQHLDGYSAVAYGRIREGTSDFDRIRRQQQVTEGLVDKLSSPRSAFKLWGVYRAYDGAVETDLGMRQSAGLFVLLKRIGTDRIVTRSLGDAAVSCATCTAALVQLVPEEASRIISEAFDDTSAGQTAAQLLVQAGVTP